MLQNRQQVEASSEVPCTAGGWGVGEGVAKCTGRGGTGQGQSRGPGGLGHTADQEPPTLEFLWMETSQGPSCVKQARTQGRREHKYIWEAMGAGVAVSGGGPPLTDSPSGPHRHNRAVVNRGGTVGTKLGPDQGPRDQQQQRGWVYTGIRDPKAHGHPRPHPKTQHAPGKSMPTPRTDSRDHLRCQQGHTHARLSSVTQLLRDCQGVGR